jgi:hypothetical protein
MIFTPFEQHTFFTNFINKSGIHLNGFNNSEMELKLTKKILGLGERNLRLQ